MVYSYSKIALTFKELLLYTITWRNFNISMQREKFQTSVHGIFFFNKIKSDYPNDFGKRKILQPANLYV